MSAADTQSKSTKRQDPVFPMKHDHVGGGGFSTVGLTKREMLAAMALQGMLSNSVGIQRLVELNGAGKIAERALANAATLFADSLLERLGQ